MQAEWQEKLAWRKMLESLGSAGPVTPNILGYGVSSPMKFNIWVCLKKIECSYSGSLLVPVQLTRAIHFTLKYMTCESQSYYSWRPKFVVVVQHQGQKPFPTQVFKGWEQGWGRVYTKTVFLKCNCIWKSPGVLLKMQIWGTHPEPTKVKLLGMRLNNLHCFQNSRWFWWPVWLHFMGQSMGLL